jgi:O-glycosyl hydrolase
MNLGGCAKVSPRAGSIFALMAVIGFGTLGRAQTVYVVDQFDPAGTGGNSYAAGQITNVWGNWFGGAFSNLVWDAASDASNNPNSGSMKITANFTGTNGSSQFEVYDGFYGISPPLSGVQYTNFQCDVRFAQGSATVTNGGVPIFGHLEFGTTTNTYGQDYFGSVDVPASNTNWVHVSIPLSVQTDPNLQSINNVLIHIYGPYYSPGLSGVSTLWVDNIRFVGVTPVPTNCVVDWTNVLQRIDGFGASSAWDSTWTTNQADIFFSTNLGVVFSDSLGNKYTNNGVGLSLLRNRIVPAGTTSASDTPTTVETNIMQWAQARGAKVWSTPWTPPAGFKSVYDIYDTNQATGGGLYGGSFRGGTATNLAYASQLANYAASMKNTYGVNLYAISIQNEPDEDVTTYEACQWTNTLIHDFVTNLYNALVAKGVGSTKIMLPESGNWQDYQNLAGPAMADPNVAADVGIIADHNYDGANGPANLTKNSYGKALWETEVCQLSGESSSIANGVYYAQRIFLFLTVAQANAWHYWWLVPYGSNTGLMDTNAAPTKRLFTVGNYSRFVRPGYYRIDVTNHSPITSISAYKDTNSGNFAIVAINPDPVTVTQIFNLTNFTANSVTPWITSSNLSLANQTAVSVANASFTYALPAMSVVTFVGQGTTNPPPIATTLTLTTSGSPATYGNAVTFTATVRTNGVTLGAISGETVAFYDGGTQLGTGTLNGSGQAAYTTTATQLAAVTHSITAEYGGDSTYSGSTNSPALSQIINPATLTAGLTGTVGKNYNGTTAATLAPANYTLSGVVSGDTVTLNNPTSGTYDNRNQGTGKTVTVTGLTISGASTTNYTLSSTSASGTVGTINKTNITVTAAANAKTYDGTTSAAATPTVTSGSLQTGDAANFTETYDTKNVGTGKTLTPAGTVSDGNGGNNYNYTFVTSANGTITAATLTYTANPASMTYGSAVPGLSGSVSGFVGSDTQGNATTGTLTFTTPATSSSSVSSYAINGSGLTAINGNYTFVQAAGNATALTINALVVSLTGTRPYDGTTAAAAGILSVANKVGSDNVTVASGSGTLASAKVGSEPITSFGTLTLGGTASGNYTLAGAGGSVNITTAGLTVTNLLALNKVYDGTTNAALNATNAGLAGICDGDDVTLVMSNAVANFADKNVGTNKPVAVNNLALGGAAATNYAVSQPTNLTASIAPAGLTVTGVTAANKVYDGTTNATLNGTATLSGLVDNDVVILVTSNVTASFADANVGTNKPVTVTGYAVTGTDAGNYTLAQPAGLTADILPLVTPTFARPGIAAGAEGWLLSFSAQAGQSYKVLATGDLTVPLSQWTVLASGRFGPTGAATFTDGSAANLPLRFYEIVSP